MGVPRERIYSAFARFGINIEGELSNANSQDDAERIHASAVARAKTAYRQLLKENHPDHGGSVEATRELVSLWEIVERTSARAKHRPPPQPAFAGGGLFDFATTFSNNMFREGAGEQAPQRPGQPHIFATSTGPSVRIWWGYDDEPEPETEPDRWGQPFGDQPTP